LINGLPREPNNEITALGWFNFKKNIIWRNNREDTKQFMCFVNKYPFCDKSKGEYSKNKNDDSSVSQQNVKIFKKSIIDPELSQVTKFAKSFNNNKESRKLEDIVSLNSNGKVRKTFFHNSRIIQRKSWRDKYEESGNNKVKINNKTLGLLKERRMISKSSVMAFVRFSEYLSRRHDNINKGKYNYIKLKIEKNRNYFRNLSNFSINYLPK
jgi:hypothetical protein